MFRVSIKRLVTLHEFRKSEDVGGGKHHTTTLARTPALVGYPPAGKTAQLQNFSSFIFLSCSFQLDVYKRECKRLQEDQEGSRRDIKRHPSIDRSKSYPETSSLSYKEDTLDPMSSIALPPSMCSKREGYLSLRDFRHEQLKRVSISTVGRVPGSLHTSRLQRRKL
jgi:hypothetical protein